MRHITGLAPPRESAQTTSSSQNRLWYTSSAGQFGDALPIGNGRIGAMIYGGVSRERLQLNEDTLWAGGPYTSSDPDTLNHLPEIRKLLFEGKPNEAEVIATEHFMANPSRQAAYQVLGDLYIDMPGLNQYAERNYVRDLNIDSAMATVEYTHSGTKYTRRIVASPTRQVIAILLTVDRPGRLKFNVHASSPHGNSSFTPSETGGLLKGRNGPRDGVKGAVKFEARFTVTSDGAMETGEDYFSVNDATSATILLSMATNFKGPKDMSNDPSALSQSHLDSCKGMSFDDIAEETATAHRTLFRRTTLNIGETQQASLPTDQRVLDMAAGKDDPSLISLYFQYGRYLLICCSRPGSQAANLQGIWNESLAPPWDSKYTININTEMNYWPAESTSMPELVEPLVTMIKRLAVAGRQTAKDMYGARGWVAHHNTDLWGGSAPIDLPTFGMWPLGGAWLCQHLWDHYDFSRDVAFLEDVYQVMVDACLFFVDALVEHPDEPQYLVTCPSMSPENQHGIGGAKTTLCAGPTMDNQILRELFNNTISAGKVLDRDRDLAAELKSTRDRLRPDQIGKDGRIQEWAVDVAQDPEPDHRHTSHLYGLFPGHEITLDGTPDLAKGCKAALIARGDPTTGWAAAWRINLWAHLGEAEHAHEVVTQLLSEWSLPNLFDLHPPLSRSTPAVFQIDGNLGGVSGIAEMLVQGRVDGQILLLPALPKAWGTGSVSGLRVRGNWTVDVEWRGGKLTLVTLHAKVGGTREVVYGKHKLVTLETGQTLTLGAGLDSV
jgi:alpha-L-fucosidase 2